MRHNLGQELFRIHLGLFSRHLLIISNYCSILGRKSCLKYCKINFIASLSGWNWITRVVAQSAFSDTQVVLGEEMNFTEAKGNYQEGKLHKR